MPTPIPKNALIRVNGKRLVNGNIHYTFNRVNGSVLKQEVNGPASDVSGLLDSYPFADEIDFEQTGETAKLTVSQIDSAQATLDIDFSEITGSIFKNPTFVSISTDRIKAINNVLEVFQDGKTKKADVDKALADAALTALELKALNLLELGVTDYTWDVCEVTWTRTVPRNYAAVFDITQTGKVFTTAGVVGITGAPILFAIPATVNNVGTPAGFSLGWRMRMKVQFVANGAGQLIMNFQYGAYSTDLYTFGG